MTTLQAYSLMTLTIACLLICSCRPSSTSNSNTPDKVVAYGQAEAGIQYCTFAGPDFIDGNRCFDRRIHYHVDGRLKSDVEYEKCEVVWRTILYHYDESGRIIGSSLASRFENIEYVWKYDEKDRLIERRAALPTSFYPSRVRYDYDDAGRLIRETGDFVNGMPSRENCRIEYEYEESLKVATTYYGGPECNEIKRVVRHFYDEDRREQRRHIYSDAQKDEFVARHLHYTYY